MLKIYLILYVGTGIGGTWEVPTLPDCAELAASRQALISQVVREGRTLSGMRVTVAQKTALRSWKFKCEALVVRPKIGDDI